MSNGHGEDAIACKVFDRLCACGLARETVDAWPVVGEGRQYRTRGIACVGVSNLLPSDGFATLSAARMWRDLRAGWIRVHVEQIRAAARLRGRYTMALAVGDVVPMALAAIARVPFIFVGCAKSVFYGRRYGYTGLEVRLLRRYAAVAFPRDEPTTAWLRARRVRARYVGNPMMDDLEPTGALEGVPDHHRVIGALPGSRGDMTANTIAIARVAAELGGLLPDPSSVHVLCAAADGIEEQVLRAWVASRDGNGWRPIEVACGDTGRAEGCVLKLVHRSGLQFQVLTGRFADVLHRSTVVIGLAGTANEQAIGLGRPVITFPTRGAFDGAYLRMKTRFLGDSTLAVSPDPGTVARAVRDLLANPEQQAHMAEAGRRRMGGLGGSEAIAATVVAELAARHI